MIYAWGDSMNFAVVKLPSRYLRPRTQNRYVG
jgi:hypothetical protein